MIKFTLASNIIILIIVIIVLSAFIAIIIDRNKVKYDFPKIKIKIDISGRRKPSYEECIDQWIIENHRIKYTDMFMQVLNSWDNNWKEYLEKTWFWKKHKGEVYEEMRRKIVDANYTMFEFYFIRNQTRYKQENYQKTAYTVENVEKIIACTLNNMVKINDELNDINYETTREKYFAKNQRKLMTKELRRKIMERDNYTCQKCGKYMPDEVGLQVDHIVAIKNGGKTVESNLQVLCDKCNLSKGAKEQS